jgi:ATP/maltotriose-dependent transcriptional regulator MalT
MPLPVSLGTAWKPFDQPSTLHTLSPPRLDGLISRSRLLRQMDQPGGVVTIVGPPLIGKTCLAASWTESIWVTERATNLFWYQITDADGDIAKFFELLGEAVAKRFPNIPNLPAYSAEADLRNFTAAWLKAFLGTRPRSPIAFIFDDVHRLLLDAPLLLVLRKLARAIGNEDSLILISRQEVPAQITDAARRRQRLVRITDLKVDESEFADFERSATNIGSLTRTAFLAALRHSGHWMAGLPLRPLTSLPARVMPDKIPDLLAGLSDAERAALVATAYLQVGLERDWTLLGGKMCVTVLSKLETATGLVRRLQNRALRKHDTFFEQLRTWAEATTPSKDLVKGRAATARFLISRGEVLSGVSLLLAAEAFEEVRAVVLEHASHLIDQAKNKELLDVIAALPDQQQTQPAIQVWAAYARLPFSGPGAHSVLIDGLKRQHTGAQECDACAAIHGALYCFQSADLTLGLPVAPRLDNRIANCVEITLQRSCKALQGVDTGVVCFVQPGI